MKSPKASRVKKAGHNTERFFAYLIGVKNKNIVTGTGKTDLFNKDGKRISLKSSHDKKGRSQICLYKYSSKYFKDTNNGSTKRMQECLVVFPPTHGEYSANKQAIKKLLQEKMIALQKYINTNKANKREFLDFVFFTDHDNKKIDFLVVTDWDSNFYVFEASEVLDIFCEHTKVENSKARHEYETTALKVIFKGMNEKGKYINLIENEIRTSTHYRTFLSVGNKLKYLFVLLSNIKPQIKVKPGLILCGRATKNFNF